MSEGRSRRRRLLWVAGAVAATVVVLLVGGFFYVKARDSATAVSVDDVLDEFRGTEAATLGALGRPEPGVYVYATVGEEWVDALGGASHRYPDETTITVTPTECGYRSRWDALRERWDELDLCVNEAGESAERNRQYHEFFGFGADLAFACDTSQVIRAHPPQPGERRTTLCSDGEANTEMTLTVVGVEEIAVADTTVEAVHVSIESILTGSVRGRSEIEYWAVPETGLVLKRHSTVDSDTDSPLGTTKYQEEYTLELVSLQPRT